MGHFKQTRIPLGLDRYVYLTIACIFIVFHGAIIMNWTPLRKMLIKDGAFAWTCDPTDVLDGDGTCGNQREKIAQVGNIGQTCMFVGSLVGGVISDRFGPKVVGTFGCLLFVLAYLFLAVSSQSAQLYIPWAIIQGFAAECSFFGILSVPNLFPRYRGLVLSLLGSGRSISMFYSMAQNAMVGDDKLDLRGSQFVCMGISAFWTIVMFVILPSRVYLLEADWERERMAAGLPVTDREDARSRADSGLTSMNESISPEAAKTKRKADFKDFIQAALHPYYICWVIAFTFMYSRGSFYAISVADQHPKAGDAFGYVSPLSFIPCPLLGALADMAGMMSVLVLLNACGTVMFICLISGTNVGAQYIGVVCSCIVLSFLASQNYVLIQEQYGENVRGKLAGVAMFVAGIVNLIASPIYNWATRDHTFKKADGLYLGFTGLAWLMMLAMWFVQPVSRQEQIEHKQMEMEVAEHQEAVQEEYSQTHPHHTK